MNIAGIRGKINELLARVPDGTLITLVVIVGCIFSFGLGVLFGQETRGGEVSITQIPLSEELPGQKALTAGVGATSIMPPSAEAPAMPAGGQYVASKKGTKYHLPWCSGAKTMNEENKIWFASKEEAEKAGYTPAGNCKGI